jgi:DNA-3-methyladenine glycosylase II
MRKLRVSRQKAKYISGIAKLFVEGSINEAEIEKNNDEDVLRGLMEINGVGRWSAEYVMMRGLGRIGVIPAVGTGIRKSFAHFFGMKKAEEEDVRRLSGKWDKYKGLAAFYLRFAYYDHMYKIKRNDSE